MRSLCLAVLWCSILSGTLASINSKPNSNLNEVRDNELGSDSPTAVTGTASPNPDNAFTSIVDYFSNVDYESGVEMTDECQYRVDNRLWTKSPETFSPPDCSAVFATGNASQLRPHHWTPNQPHDENSTLDLVKNCSYLRRVIPFPDKPASDEDQTFPLAYIFVGERNADQTLRLFRSIYWPQNAYCFTYDNKSTQAYKEFMVSLASCFPNVMVNPSPIDVHWGQDSVLYNVMSCFRPLENSSIPWKYVQVVSYNDFPLKTNSEMVKIMKLMNGSNDCDLVDPIPSFYYKNGRYKRDIDIEGAKQKSVPPEGLIIFKGSYATTMTREFVRFALEDPVSKKLYKWLDGTWCPEEHFWPTLIHNLHARAPGAFPGQCLWFYKRKKTKKTFLSRCQVWADRPLDGHTCMGNTVKWSCVYGVGDVPWLMERPEFIAHKFYGEFQPAALYCLEKWHWDKVCKKSTRYIDQHLNFYQNLPAVRYQKAVDKEEFRC